MLVDQYVSLFKTKTFWGVAVSALGKALAVAGYELGPDDQQILIAGLPFLLSFVGDLWGIYGRLKAEKKAVIAKPAGGS